MKLKGYLTNNKKVEITIDENIITNVEELSCDVPNQYIVPGFIETHSHGGYNFDFIHQDLKGAKNFLNKIALLEGTTSIIGTTITTDKEKVINAINSHKELVNKKHNGANLLGYHIEGPFINPEKKGAHPVEKMLSPNFDNIKEFLSSNFDLMKLITIAPELSDKETLKKLHDSNVVLFAGHTMANKEDVENTFIEGITHFNNAMVKYEQGGSLAKWSLYSNDIYIEFINDGIHNSLELAREIYKNKPKDKLILITDSLHIKGLEDGEYPGPNWTITKKDGAAWTPEGILNGSVYTQLKAFQDWVNIIGATLEEAQLATSTNAANLFKLNKGKIKKGYDADIILLDKDLNLLKTFVNGKEIEND